MSAKRKFGFAMIAFATLGVLCWLTLSNDPVVLHDFAAGYVVHLHFRSAALAVLGIWTLLTTLAFLHAQNDERRDAARRK